MNAPTEWTCGGLLDWTDAKQIKLMYIKSPQLIIRALIEALRERVAVSANLLSFPNQKIIFTDDYNPLQSQLYYFNKISETIGYLLPNPGRFMNPSDYDENGPLTPETDASIGSANLETILGEVLLTVPGKFTDPIDWIMQQYKILNLFRWIKANLIRTFDSLKKSGSSDDDLTRAGTISNTISDYNASGDTSESNIKSYFSVAYNSGTERWSASMNNTHTVTVTPSFVSYTSLGVLENNLSCNADFYGYGRIELFSSHEYQTNNIFRQDWLTKVASVPSIITPTTITSDSFELNIATPAAPVQDTGVREAICTIPDYATGTFSFGVGCIFKFDIENGFQFKDW